jgi:hypothetical protein
MGNASFSREVRNFLRCLPIRFSTPVYRVAPDPVSISLAKVMNFMQQLILLGISLDTKPIGLFPKAATTMPRAIGPAMWKLPRTGVDGQDPSNLPVAAPTIKGA